MPACRLRPADAGPPGLGERPSQQRSGALSVPAYDLATLQRGRYRWGLHVADGLAVTYHWIARAEEGVYAVDAADSHAVNYYRDPVPRPSYRAAMRALLADLQRYVGASPSGPATALVADHAASTGETAWYVAPDAGPRLGIPAACTALVHARDQLLGVRRHRQVYVLVVRAGTVMAAIRGGLAGGTAHDLGEALPTVHRRYRQYRYRSEP